ncbi:hypothetical protein BKA70DRAFT_1474420 [Coprinopsis sp. MPI-PUGE-AT-0042]|nr:hypothetical protein BKA70DRAFT_1474420 [Coprinopsis sp. MPI-PUGE-AT-0042]
MSLPHFALDPADYLLSLTAKYILSELGSPGKSGSFFYFSRDYRSIVKTIRHSEHKFLLRILKQYYERVRDNPHTLLSRGKMLELGPEKRALLVEQIKRDAEFLKTRGNKDNLRRNTWKIFSPELPRSERSKSLAVKAGTKTPEAIAIWMYRLALPKLDPFLDPKYLFHRDGHFHPKQCQPPPPNLMFRLLQAGSLYFRRPPLLPSHLCGEEGRGEREQIIAHVGHNVLSQQTLVNRESRDEDQFYADWGLGSPHTASSKHGPLVNPTLSPASLGAAEADISSIMDDVRLDDESSMYDLSPETVDHILAQHGEALMLHQAALRMHRVSSIALSEIKRRKNALFGEGVWIIHHLDNLDEAQHRAARKAMARWDTVYQEGLNRAAHRLLFSVAHCSPSYPEFPHDSENL